MDSESDVTVRLSREATDRLDRLAKSTGRDRGALAAQAIESFLDDAAWQLEAIGKAVHEVDAGGEVYDHEEVMTYLERRLVEGPTIARPRPSRDS